MPDRTARAGGGVGLIACLLLHAAGGPTAAQAPGGKTGGSPNITLMSHVPLDGYFTVGGLDLEQEPERPYAYLSRMFDQAGFTIVSLADPANAKVLYDWRVDNLALHVGVGGESGRYFKRRSRYYYVKAFLFERGTPDGDVGAVVFDVTGLPAVSQIKEVGRIRSPGGFIDVFPYRHSDGRVLIFATPWTEPRANVYDVDKLLAGDPNQGLIGQVPNPQAGLPQSANGYHDAYAAYDPASQRDRFYGAGSGGFHVYDVTKPEEPKFLFSLTGGAGVVSYGHTLAPTNDGRYAVAFTERQFWPVLVFDLKAGLEGSAATLSSPVGGWTADWRDASHTGSVLWPYVFVAAFEDGLQIFNLIDPQEPKTEGWYYTCVCAHQTGFGGIRNVRGTSVFNGAADVAVRNADGLIAMTDYTSGFWAFRMAGFRGWSGRHWKVPNISREQDWDHGPAEQARRER